MNTIKSLFAAGAAVILSLATSVAQATAGTPCVYTLHFDGNGNRSGTPPADKNLTSVEEYVLPEPGMTCGCARFLGWATNATAAATYQPGDKVKCLTSEDGGSVTLYATWEDVFVLAFDNNASGAVGSHIAYTNAIGETFTIYRDAGSQVTIEDYGKSYQPYRIGWRIANWNMSSDGTGTAVLSQDQYSQNVSSSDFGASRGDVITLHAQWYETSWTFNTLDPQLNGGKWQIRVRGDEYAEITGVSEEFTWSDTLTLPASYNGRTIGSLASTLENTDREVATKLKHVTVPEGYTNLCDYAFRYLYALESVRFPSTLQKIPNNCCNGCDKLTTVVFAEGNREIGENAFCGCGGLPSIVLPRGLTNLAYCAFYGCTNLSEFVLSPDYVGSTSPSYVLYNCPVAKLEIPASCVGFGYYSLNKVAALRFLGDRPMWNVNYANHEKAKLFEFPATNTTWNAGKINYYQKASCKGFVGPIAAFGVSDAYFWTNANETVTFAYAESPLAATVTLPEGTISWGGVEWEIVGFEPDAFAGQATTTVYYPIAECAKWEQVAPPAGVTLAPVPGTYFTLNFHVNGGEAYRAAMTFPPSTTRALPSVKPTKSGYKFLGWATTGDGSPVYQAGDDYTAGAVGASVTLYAKWQEVGNYTIRFNGNSAYATGVPAEIVTAVGTTPAIPSPAPVREGWAFGGWTNAVNANVYQTGDAFDEGCTKDQVFTLYAKWTEMSVNPLAFTDDDGTKWAYKRKGDSVWVTDVIPGPLVEKLVLPDSIKGSTTTLVASDVSLPEKVDGLWWKFIIVAGKARVTGYIGTVPANLVVPSTLGGKEVNDIQGQHLFNLVDTLVSVTIPGTIPQLYRYHFNNCPNLETVTLQSGVQYITDCFVNCPKLKEIAFPEHFRAIRQFDGFGSGTGGSDRGFDGNGFRYADTLHKYLIALDPNKTGAVEIPDGVVWCNGGTFKNNKKMTSWRIPEGLNLEANMLSGSTLTEVNLPESVTWNGTYACGTTTITNAIVRGGAPSWNLKSYFTGLTTVSYYANRAAEWADYKSAHTDVNYVEICVEATSGLYLKYNLVKDLGVEIDADYAVGDKVTVKVEGLAKGLKLVTTAVYVDPTAKKKVIKDYTYTIEGVPTEAIDFAKNPMYARVTVTKGKVKTETLQPIVLSIVAPEPEELVAGVLNENYEPIDIAALWPAVADAKVNPKNWTFKTWPAGIKYNASAKPITTKNKDKSVTTNAAAWTVYGKPTKAGVYPITATHKRKLADGKTTVSETYSATFTVWGDDGATDFRYTDQAYEPTETKELGATVTGVSGQPTGIKFDKNSGKLSGTPTKSGVYATTVTYSDKTKKTFLWKVTEGKNDGFLGTMDWTVKDSAVTVMQGVIQTNWTCKLPADAKVTAKLPTGLKLAQNKDKSWTLSGTPTAVGNNVATFTTVRNGVTVTEWISIIVTANAWTGSWYGLQYCDQVASLMAEVTVSANGTVKLVYTEGTTNVTAKGVVSEVTKTTVTVKNLDANGTTATLVLPRNKKDPLSVDRRCVIDFKNQGIDVYGAGCPAEWMDLGERVTDGVWPDVMTAVMNEYGDGETNAYALVTATYNAKNATFALAGKLWDGTAIKGTAQAVAGDNITPVMVVDKAKNAVTIGLYLDSWGRLCVRVYENGKAVKMGWTGNTVLAGKYAAADLKSKKYSSFTDDNRLYIVQEDGKKTELTLTDKDMTAALSAQGLVKFTLTDVDGWKWVCEMLVTDMAEPYNGIATGTKKGEATRYRPVHSAELPD